MSWDWNDRELIEWAQKTLPEFLLVSMQDPDKKKKSVALTPWDSLEVCVAEVQVDGEVNLIGKKVHSLLQFDLDIGIRVDIEKRLQVKGEDGTMREEVLYWPGILQISHFENQCMRPPFSVSLQEVPQAVADEVSWYLTQGLGQRYIWHGLARWHAYAVKKWLKEEPPAIEDPHVGAPPPPAFPPFREDERRRHLEEIRRELLGGDGPSRERLEDDWAGPAALTDTRDDRDRGALAKREPSASKWGAMVAEAQVPAIGPKVADLEERPYESQPVSDDEDDYDPDAPFEFDGHTFEKRRKGAPPKMKKFGRFPFLPSMLSGIGGPATGWLRPKEFAVAHPEWFQEVKDGATKGSLTGLDLLLDKARQKREDFEKLAGGREAAMRAAELCDAIERGDVMKAFARLDDETASCPHPETGRSAAHACVVRGSLDLLQMVIEAKADLNLKDSFGQTALMMAAKRGDAELTKALLDAGADATQEDALGRSACDMVAVKPLEQDHPLKNWREKLSGDPVPEDPAKKAHDLKSLISERERPKKYGLMLLNAVQQKDVRTAESSIEAGGFVDCTDERGDSPLLLLAKGKWKDQEGLQVRLAEKIHKAGGDLDLRNAQGNTALHFCAHRGNGRLAEELLRLKADATLTNSEGNTALMYAAHGGHEAVCSALLEAFAPAAARNQFGLTAEEMASRRGFRSCAILIQAYEMAPKKHLGDEDSGPKKKEKKAYLAFDYSKWNQLEKDMQADEETEQHTKQKENNSVSKRPAPKMEDLGPEAFGLPADTPWPPEDPAAGRKGPFDYSRWDRIVDDIEQQEKVVERYEHLQQNPQYEYRNGTKMQIIF